MRSQRAGDGPESAWRRGGAREEEEREDGEGDVELSPPDTRSEGECSATGAAVTESTSWLFVGFLDIHWVKVFES